MSQRLWLWKPYLRYFLQNVQFQEKSPNWNRRQLKGQLNPQFQSGSECDSFWQSSHWTTSILPLSLNDAEQGFTKRGNYLKEQMRVMRFLSHEMRWDCGAIMAHVYWSCSQTTTDPHNITKPLTNILSSSKESTLTCWWTITLCTRSANKLIAKDKKSQIHSPTICCVDENFNIHTYMWICICVYIHNTIYIHIYFVYVHS